MSHRWSAEILRTTLLMSVFFWVQATSAQQPTLVPTTPLLSPAVAAAMEQPWLTEPERRQMRLFHGVWDERDLVTPEDRASAALMLWKLNDPLLNDPRASNEVRAEAHLRRGDPKAALEVLVGLPSVTTLRQSAEAHERLGDLDFANEQAEAVVAQVNEMDNPTAQDLTEHVRASRLLQRINDQPSNRFQSMMKRIGRAHQQVDRLYWPAKLVEAEILFEKGKVQESIAALHEVIALNPRSSEAWYLLGLVALENMLFDEAQRAADILDAIEPGHPKAGLLRVETSLRRDDPEGALEMAKSLSELWPGLIEPHIQAAAAHALLYDRDSADQELAIADAMAPGSPQALFEVGRHLLRHHQYDAAAAYLAQARKRRPNWAAPVIELSRIALQTGQADAALVILEQATRLDPFHVAAANYRFLLEELADYETIETEHFVIRYKPGVDEVLVAMMPDVMEEIYENVTKPFNFEPRGKTYLEVMPDHQRFSVRVVGMPDVHTIAACTGPVIAMEVPRSGRPSQHRGTFDWPRVLQHEFTHTVNLAQSNNRVPRWLTEGAAVQMEGAGRTYERNVMLANALHAGDLFTMDEIDWAFIRPKKPGDIGQAYSQGNWMVEFIIEQWGMPVLVDLLDRMQKGDRSEAAFLGSLGIGHETFFERFVMWAQGEVRAWGLAAEPSIQSLVDQAIDRDPRLSEMTKAQSKDRLNQIARLVAGEVGRPGGPGREAMEASQWPAAPNGMIPISDEVLDDWIGTHPTHPDLVEMKMLRLLDRKEVTDEQRIEWLERYVALRPIDPAPRRRLIKLLGADGLDEQARLHLEFLDHVEANSPVYAVQLAESYRQSNDLDRALSKMTRAVEIHPYHAPYRELAAAIAVEANALAQAHRHIVALTILEPGRPLHKKRLEAIDALLEKQEQDGL